ncbi:hypothetical protein RF11_09246 [Thelohanellus kitauei]|uniref:Uncharacterized protein n=1 Tax=Thelohanellus kitauei TaxID=669202 RepID=A0A0C2MV60_THEKT|nr:hypothetical protein RF11_09246 [Thelohanellus kitauei]
MKSMTRGPHSNKISSTWISTDPQNEHGEVMEPVLDDFYIAQKKLRNTTITMLIMIKLDLQKNNYQKNFANATSKSQLDIDALYTVQTQNLRMKIILIDEIRISIFKEQQLTIYHLLRRSRNSYNIVSLSNGIPVSC